MENIVIRDAKIEELEEIVAMADQLAISDLPYDKEVDVAWARTPDGEKYYREKVEQISGRCFIAEMNGAIMGYATVAEKEVPSYRKVKVVDLENLFVKEAFRSKGLGKVFIEYYLKWAKDIGADKAAVSVYYLNEKGMAFYNREGFNPYDMTLEISLDK